MFMSLIGTCGMDNVSLCCEGFLLPSIGFSADKWLMAWQDTQCHDKVTCGVIVQWRGEGYAAMSRLPKKMSQESQDERNSRSQGTQDDVSLEFRTRMRPRISRRKKRVRNWEGEKERNRHDSLWHQHDDMMEVGKYNRIGSAYDCQYAVRTTRKREINGGVQDKLRMGSNLDCKRRFQQATEGHKSIN